MVELNADCLDIIFGFLTPVEWIQISEVCQLWKTVVKRRWQKFNTISYVDINSRFEIIIQECPETQPVVLQTEDAKKIVRHLAQHCKAVVEYECSNDMLNDSFPDPRYVILMLKHQFKYKLEGFTVDHLLKLIAENATEIKELHFFAPPRTKLLQLLLKSNQINKLHIITTPYHEFWTEISTDGIEDLDIKFHNLTDDFTSFEGHFVNLQKLTLGFQSSNLNCDFQPMISRTVPYVTGIKSLKLWIESPRPPIVYLMEDIGKCTNLDELVIQYYWQPNFNSLKLNETKNPKFNESFDPSSFAKLRALTLNDFDVTDIALKCMLLLPNLEKLEVDQSVEGFRYIDDLPEMKKLSVFDIQFKKAETVNLTNLYNAVKKMPNLQSLCVRGITDEQVLMVASEAVIMAASQNKDVLVEKCFKGDKVLEVERKKDVCSTTQVLTLKFKRILENELYVTINTLVEKRLKGYNVIKLKID